MSWRFRKTHQVYLRTTRNPDASCDRGLLEVDTSGGCIHPQHIRAFTDTKTGNVSLMQSALEDANRASVHSPRILQQETVNYCTQSQIIFGCRLCSLLPHRLITSFFCVLVVDCTQWRTTLTRSMWSGYL